MFIRLTKESVNTLQFTLSRTRKKNIKKISVYKKSGLRFTLSLLSLTTIEKTL